MAVTGRHVGAAVFAAGALLVVYGAVRWWHDERVFARMQPTTCTLLSKKVESRLIVPTTRRGSFKAPPAFYRYEIHLVFAHTLDGRQYAFPEDLVEDREPRASTRFEEGRAYPCRYDPQNLRYGTVTGMSDDWGTLPLGLAVMCLGALLPRRWRAAAGRVDEMRRR